jgi:hypothetical protein
MRWTKFFFFLLFLSLSWTQDDDLDELDFEVLEDVETFVVPGENAGVSDWGGFLEYRYGRRVNSHPHVIENETMNELRFQFETQKRFGDYEFHVRSDFLADHTLRDEDIDLRELYFKLPSRDWLDVSIGRQIIMWGTGDVIFLNDLFPKDFNSFFMGRDAEAEYMKSPSDALKLHLYADDGGVFDYVYSPKFNPYIVPTGQRFSYFDPLRGSITSQLQNIVSAGETSPVMLMRYTRDLKGKEVSLYGYDGFWPIQNGINQNFQLYYPELKSYGFSVRGGLGKGILSLEVAYYNSVEDRQGNDPFVPNSQTRWYAGYDQELIKDLHLGVQYYHEYQKDQSAYLSTLPAGFQPRARHYEMWTTRLTHYLLHQNLALSLFVYFSPTDKDAYIRSNVFYKFSDRWHFHLGSNHFTGDRPDTVFNQSQEDSNVFFSIRYNFN